MKVLLQALSFTELGLNCSMHYFCPTNGVWKDLIALVPRKGIGPAQKVESEHRILDVQILE